MMTTNSFSPADALVLPPWLAQSEQIGQDDSLDNFPSVPRLSVSSERRELLEMMYDNFFVSVLERVANGEPLSQIVREDPRCFDIANFRSWVHRDPKRKSQYYDARAIGAESVEDELISIADASDSPMEDVQRSTLRIGTRKWLLGVWDRKRYGETKQLDINTTHTVDMRALLATRENRLRDITGECEVLPMERPMLDVPMEEDE